MSVCVSVCVVSVLTSVFQITTAACGNLWPNPNPCNFLIRTRTKDDTPDISFGYFPVKNYLLRAELSPNKAPDIFQKFPGTFHHKMIVSNHVRGMQATITRFSATDTSEGFPFLCTKVIFHRRMCREMSGGLSGMHIRITSYKLP